jgi:hypothetical protein
MKVMTVSKRAFILAMTAALALVVSSPRPSAQTAPRTSPTRTIYATVLGKDDAPVPGLGISDFAVKEDGKPREVLSVKPGGAPAHIALLVDNSQALATANAVQDIRAGLTTFIKDTLAASPSTQITIVTFGDRPTQAIDYTSSAEALQKVVDHIFGQPNAGAYMLTAIADACKTLKKKGFANSAIVAFTLESGPEFGNESHQTIEAGLKDAGASLWTLVMQGRAPQTPDNQLEQQEREIVLGDVAEASGGMRDMLLTRIGIEPHLKTLAATLAARYAITYGRPEALVPPQRLEVTVTRPGAHILAPHWSGQ